MLLPLEHQKRIESLYEIHCYLDHGRGEHLVGDLKRAIDYCGVLLCLVLAEVEAGEDEAEEGVEEEGVEAVEEDDEVGLEDEGGLVLGDCLVVLEVGEFPGQDVVEVAVDLGGEGDQDGRDDR